MSTGRRKEEECPHVNGEIEKWKRQGEMGLHQGSLEGALFQP